MDNKYLTMEEKKKLALEGKNVPIRYNKSNKNSFGNEKGIVKSLRYTPSKKDPKLKI